MYSTSKRRVKVLTISLKCPPPEKNGRIPSNIQNMDETESVYSEKMKTFPGSVPTFDRWYEDLPDVLISNLMYQRVILSSLTDISAK